MSHRIARRSRSVETGVRRGPILGDPDWARHGSIVIGRGSRPQRADDVFAMLSRIGCETRLVRPRLRLWLLRCALDHLAGGRAPHRGGATASGSRSGDRSTSGGRVDPGTGWRAPRGDGRCRARRSARRLLHTARLARGAWSASPIRTRSCHLHASCSGGCAGHPSRAETLGRPARRPARTAIEARGVVRHAYEALTPSMHPDRAGQPAEEPQATSPVAVILLTDSSSR